MHRHAVHRPAPDVEGLPGTVSPEQVMERAGQAVHAALDFFAVSSDWKVEVRRGQLTDDMVASCHADTAYLRAIISLDVDYYCRRPGALWGDMGHEVAHLVTSELMDLLEDLPADDPTRLRLRAAHRIGIERATTRLERLFLRERPMSASATSAAPPAKIKTGQIGNQTVQAVWLDNSVGSIRAVREMTGGLVEPYYDASEPWGGYALRGGPVAKFEQWLVRFSDGTFELRTAGLFAAIFKPSP